jgi:hypothetical protein
MTDRERDAAQRLAAAIRESKRAQGEDLARAKAAVAYWRDRLLDASHEAMQQGAA